MKPKNYIFILFPLCFLSCQENKVKVQPEVNNEISLQPKSEIKEKVHPNIELTQSAQNFAKHVLSENYSVHTVDLSKLENPNF